MEIYQRIPIKFSMSKKNPENFPGELFLISNYNLGIDGINELYLNSDAVSGGHSNVIDKLKEKTTLKFRYLWRCAYTFNENIKLPTEFDGSFFEKYAYKLSIDSNFKYWYFVLKEKPSEKFKEINL